MPIINLTFVSDYVLKLPAAKDPLPQFRPQSEELLKTPPTTVPAHPS